MKTKLTFFVFALIFSFSAIAQNPTVWRGDASGIYPETGLMESWPETGPEIAWVFEGLGEGHSSPVFALGHIFISSMIEKEGYIFVLSLDGKVKNKYVYGEEFFESFPGARSTPVIVGDWLYIYSGKGVIYACDAMSGTLRWKKDMLGTTDGENIRWGVTETLVVDGDMIFCSPGGKINNVVALNRQSGNTIWTSPGAGSASAYCTPLLLNMGSKKLLITMMASHIIGLDANSGEMFWSYEQPNKYGVHANTPIYDKGILACTSGYGKGTVGLKLTDDGKSVEKLWFNENFDSRMGGVVCIDGFLYASGDQNRQWRCIDIKTGIEKWESTEVGKGVVISADNKLYMYSDKGELAFADVSTEGLNIKGVTKVTQGTAQHWAHPVINNGKLYLRHGDALIAYKIK